MYSTVASSRSHTSVMYWCPLAIAFSSADLSGNLFPLALAAPPHVPSGAALI
jgi:hypothetical protein